MTSDAAAAGAYGTSSVSSASSASGASGARGVSDASGASGRQASSKPSRARLFLKASAFDFVLVLCAAVALSMTVSFGFESAPELRGNLLVVAGIAAPLLVVLFCGSWSKRAVAVSAAVAIAYAVAILAVLCALSSAENPLFADGVINDSADSKFVFGLVVLVVTTLVYLLSRRRLGAFVLLVMGILACEGVQFLYRDWVANSGTVISLASIVLLIALFIYQGYRSSVYAARRLKRTSFFAASAVSVFVAAAGIGVGVLVFSLLISSFNLSTLQIKPFKDYFIRPIMEYSANYMRQPVDDPSQTTSLLSDIKSTTRNNAPGGSQAQSPNQEEQEANNEVETGSKTSFDILNWTEALQSISYEQLVLNSLIFLALAIVLAILIVVLWRWRRRWRLRRIADKPCAWRVWYLYQFLTERLRRLGIRRKETLTLMEHALATRTALEPYSRGANADYLGLTLAYQRAVYDADSVTEADYEDMVGFYWAFYKNARKASPWWKWVFWRFWRL